MTDTRRVDALQLIFSLFLGALLVVVVGAGVWTFYPGPFGENSPEQERLEELQQQQERLGMKTGGGEFTPADQAEQRRIQEEMDDINDAMADARGRWAVNTSIILLTFATTLMAISLFLPERMRVFSNGVLLGGLFTVIYGTGWSFAGGDSRARFFVVLVALLLAVAFGYLRFVRGREAAAEPAAASPAVPSVAGATGAEPESVAALTARVEALEARAEAAARALRGTPEVPPPPASPAG
jgi:hypothetical protein